MDLPFCCAQVLSKNRWTVLYCTLLAKAESDAERERIEEEMSADPEKNAILKVGLETLMYTSERKIFWIKRDI